jgi:hypothetical protein
VVENCERNSKDIYFFVVGYTYSNLTKPTYNKYTIMLTKSSGKITNKV